MTLRPLSLAILIALSGTPAAFADEMPPPLPTLDVSTMLFLMLAEGSVYANTLGPFDVNGIDVDFGNQAAASEALDVKLDDL